MALKPVNLGLIFRKNAKSHTADTCVNAEKKPRELMFLPETQEKEAANATSAIL